MRNMSGITEGIRKRIRRIFMDRYKYTLSYDSDDQENKMVCGILAALGNKRSTVVKALIEDAVKRYGSDVFSKENVKVLLYLIGHTPQAGMIPPVQTGASALQDFQMPPQITRKRKEKRPKESGESKPEAARQRKQEEETAGDVAGGAPAISEDISATAKPEAEGKPDQMRGTLLDFLNTGMFGEE